MSLSAVLYTAQNSLFNLSSRAGVTARNIQNASDPTYARRAAVLETSENGASIVTIDRAANARVAASSRDALSQASAQDRISETVKELALALNGSDGSLSPSSLLSGLHDALQIYSSNPSDTLQANAVVESARTLATSIRGAANEIHALRARMDGDIAAAAEDLRTLLDDFHDVNTGIVKANLRGTDANDLLDRRDKLLGQIAEIVPVTVTERDNGDVMLTTANGAMLFETTPRSISFTPKVAYGPGEVGNVFRIDGVPVNPGAGADSSSTGSIAAMLQLRDEFAPKAETQIDEIARGLVATFAETDQTGGGQPPLAGLFSWSGGPAIPPAGVLVPGLAASLSVNALYDPQAGGNAAFLRDGGANGAAYVANTGGGSAFSDRIIAMTDAMSVPGAYDAAAGLDTNASILDFANGAHAWLESYRADSGAASETKTALHAALNDKLVAETGVNIDDEMASLVEIERSYEATSRIISTVDSMLAALLEAAR
ncbi:flagellar hook-associated protein FlgK [Zhengella mangrovi]|uniref:Flagellar hook-associated protein 1 n=1 Tax=Zhengella mangrovi TaxID=1982044 RepID=A0A2G1QJR8_9HYPH|nr:flagellar hook-associated protein FlgK [Zhengella mangrovi]PHP65704.1 flagellar hook-associated protein FlgK [Zhengella mangrovi]